MSKTQSITAKSYPRDHKCSSCGTAYVRQKKSQWLCRLCRNAYQKRKSSSDDQRQKTKARNKNYKAQNHVTISRYRVAYYTANGEAERKREADFRRENRTLCYVRNLRYKAKNPDLVKLYRRRTLANRSPEQLKKAAARNKLHAAIRRGNIVREGCEVCGALGAEAHHEDYAKPYAVRWLCKAHHHVAHGHRTLILSMLPVA